MTLQEPEIRFFTDSQGHSIAYAQQGKGPWLVCPAWWVSHLELDWQQPKFRELFGGLAQYFRVVRYDRPGTGLSDRERTEYSLESEAATLNDLIGHLGIAECSLFACSCGGPPALLYAARNQDKVKQLVFAGSYMDGGKLANPEMQSVMCALVQANWGLGAKVLADIFDPTMDKEAINQLSANQRKSASAEMAAQLMQLTFAMDASAVAETVDIPVLVIHRQKDQIISFKAGRDIATRLPNASLVSLPGNTHAPWMGEVGEILNQALQFLQPGATSTDTSTEPPDQFLFSGEVWTLSYAGKAVHLKDSRGLNDLHQLIANQGQELHVNALAGGGEQTAIMEQGIEALDNQALSSYRNRLSEIEQDLADPDAPLDIDDKERLLEERDAILQQLRESVGMHGRKRTLNDPTERNRKAVSARIRSSVKKISAVHPPLGQHLEQSITTGTYCGYSPETRQSWQLR